MAWYEKNSGGTTHAVGTKRANAWGLADMHGNVWEWCQDWYADKLPGGEVTNPTGPKSGSIRGLRGGCWYDFADAARSAFRYGDSRVFQNYNRSLGFRLALAPSP